MMTRKEVLNLSSAVTILNMKIDELVDNLKCGLAWYDEFWLAPCNVKDFVMDVIDEYDRISLLFLRDWDYDAARDYLQDLLVELANCNYREARTLLGYKVG